MFEKPLNWLDWAIATTASEIYIKALCRKLKTDIPKLSPRRLVTKPWVDCRKAVGRKKVSLSLLGTRRTERDSIHGSWENRRPAENGFRLRTGSCQTQFRGRRSGSRGMSSEVSTEITVPSEFFPTRVFRTWVRFQVRVSGQVSLKQYCQIT